MQLEVLIYLAIVLKLMRFNILTIFPNFFDSFLSESLIKKAIDKKLLKFGVYDLRKWTTDKHHKVDNKPYGGGAGMLMMAEPIVKALKVIKKKNAKAKVILLSPAGKQFTGALAQKLSKCKKIIFICGRYEGIDARVEKLVDEKISIGPYILNGGEIGAMVIMEAVTRFIPGFLGNKESLKEETNLIANKIVKEYPQYTRPEVLEINGKKSKVPKVLLSGNHYKIKEWRNKRRIMR